MNWKALTTSFFDELEKIGEFNLSGVSAQTSIAASQPPPPFETPGVAKALRILDRMDMPKQAEATEPSETAKKYRDAIGLGGRVAGGMGIGSMIGAAKTPAYRGGWHTGRIVGMGVGGGLGLADYLYRKKSGLDKTSSPASILARGQQVGKFKGRLATGNSLIRSPKTTGIL